MKKLPTCLGFALLIFLFSCKKENNLVVQEIPNSVDNEFAAAFYVKTELPNFQTKLPDYLVTMGLSQPEIDNAKAALGRVIFYDKNLSKDATISCASCHKQSNAFADNVPFSKGVDGQVTARNSMTLTNVANFAAHYTEINGRKPALLWDGRAASVAEQAPLAFTNAHEMGMSMVEVVEKVKELTYYPYFFVEAYGDKDVTETRILEGLQEFVKSMGGATSKLDMALAKVNGDLLGVTTVIIPQVILQHYYGPPADTIPGDTLKLPLLNFTDSELRGRTLFAENCTKCHTPIRTVQESFMACNGLDVTYPDKGLGAISGRPEDDGVFKSPSLRNIAYTAPYMHDGRFSTLNEVLDFYSTGIQASPNLHPLLKDANGQPLRMHFSDQDKKDLIAFLKTMSSGETLYDPRFSNPFN